MKRMAGAILLDTRSIQKYVFGSNELKTNTAASYLVDAIFTEVMCGEILPEMGFACLELGWKDGSLKMYKDDRVDCEVAYIGGGNMLILVRKGADESEILDNCRKIVRRWTRQLLVRMPGLKTGAAVKIIRLEEECFSEEQDALYKLLKENQNMVMPKVDPPYTGITITCPVTGKTAEVYDIVKNRFISKETAKKLEAFKVAAKQQEERYAKELTTEAGSKLDFSYEFEKMGYLEGESYLCVIHVDGNNMGAKFQSCKTMEQRKALSLKVAKNVDLAVRKLVKKLVEESGDLEAMGLDVRKLQERGELARLPFRPIIIGGDDITFVCPGRLGLVYTKYFMEALTSMELIEDNLYEAIKDKYAELNSGKQLKKQLNCCAGVAIVPAKYPFFRAYQLAEQLCGAAKKNSRELDDSWLEFCILYGEASPELEQIREEQYSGADGRKLHFGPYLVGEAREGVPTLEGLLALNKALMRVKESRLPRNKAKALRAVLAGDLHSQENYKDNTPEILKLIEQWGPLFVNKKTPYVDAMEIDDFLPKVFPKEDNK